jgi:hypothetical protein
MTTTDTIDDTRPEALRGAAYASLQGSAKSKAANALVETVFAQVAFYETKHSTFARKPGPLVHEAIGAFLADLLVAQSDDKPSEWVFRALHAKGFSGGPVGYKVFKRVLDALKGLGLVEHAEGFPEYINSAFGKSLTQRWAARFKATPALLDLTAKHRVPLQSAVTHFAFKYELPKEPLEKRMAKLTHFYTSKQVRGSSMPFDHTEASKKLEGEVRELNEFLSRQQIEGGVLNLLRIDGHL